jgi:uncharacterized protein (DUF697 family)
MVKSLSGVYDIDFKETEGKALITALAGSGLSRLGASALIKMIPGIGSALGGVSMSALSGASTYALGQVFKTHFETGGTFLDFDTDRFRKFYDEQFEKGKKVAEDLKEEAEKKKSEKKGSSEPEDIEVVNIKEEKSKTEPKAEPKTEVNNDIVKKLKEMGVINEEEFTQMKGRLIENFGK